MNIILPSQLIRLLGSLFNKESKLKYELRYWRLMKFFEGNLKNSHYERVFTNFFDLSKEDYAYQKVLDIGCGPRGSLEWCNNADELIGLDPLAKEYLSLNNKFVRMKLVEGKSENIPFEDSRFHIVTSFNSLDHVDDVDKTISEIKRVTKKHGLFLLITDCGHHPTPTEPQSFGWNIIEKFSPEFALLFEKKLEKVERRTFKNVEKNIPYNFSDTSDRYGLLVAKFRRK